MLSEANKLDRSILARSRKETHPDGHLLYFYRSQENTVFELDCSAAV